IFLDMAVPVDAQGDMLDNIETHVSNAVDHVQDGNNALQKAKTLQRNSRKWMCIAILILLIIVVVGMLVEQESKMSVEQTPRAIVAKRIHMEAFKAQGPWKELDVFDEKAINDLWHTDLKLVRVAFQRTSD
ncbi:hypothetical protein RJ639_026641, partial [Escallonia herrerae]